MSVSSIEWTDRTWNPVRGCTRVSEGCRNCYAERLAARNLPDMRDSRGKALAQNTPNGPRWTGRVELVRSKLLEPLTWRRPQRVFVNSMSDLFHERLTFGTILEIYTVMARANKHTFQVLTKRPTRRREFQAWLTAQQNERGVAGPAHPLTNVWEGVSIEDQQTADERIPALLQTPAAKRFVSYEPALGPVDFTCIAPFDDYHTDALDTPDPSRRLDWVIVGGESGPGARAFDVGWAREAVRQCKAAGVAVFVKQLGARPMAECQDRDNPCGPNDPCFGDMGLRDRKGGDPAEWPADLRVREFPQERTTC